MRMQPRQFRIGELAKSLGVERFVVRFWEKEFGLSPSRSEGGQRFYEEKDLATLKRIKKLLYEDGLTIAGAKKVLRERGEGRSLETASAILPSHITTMDEEAASPSATEHTHTELGCTPENCKLRDQFDQLKDQLIKLKRILLKVQFQPAETLSSADEVTETQLSVNEAPVAEEPLQAMEQAATTETPAPEIQSQTNDAATETTSLN